MAQKIYLEGGGKVDKLVLEDIDRQALDGALNKDVVVLDLTSDDNSKIARWRELFEMYFDRLGASNLSFASNNSARRLKDKIGSAGLIYIPGGDTELLIKNIIKKGLDELIRNFDGVIIGISAGAYLMCDEYVKVREDSIKRLKALGIVNIKMKAHYREEFDAQLLEFSKETDIYGVPDKSSIVINEDGELSFIGEIYLFSKGEKIKMS